MKLKEIDRTANVAWSPAGQHPIYLAAGTAAQQLDATFRWLTSDTALVLTVKTWWYKCSYKSLDVIDAVCSYASANPKSRHSPSRGT